MLERLKIMGAIKDIVDLCIQLRNENRDGKVAAAISEIQSLTLSLQSEQAAIVEKNSELLTENLNLKRKMLDMETANTHAMTAIQEKHRAEIARLNTSNAKPKDELEPKAKEILKHFFDKGDEDSNHEIMRRFKIQKSVADYHLDVLSGENFIYKTQYERSESDFEYALPALYKISSTGRQYVIKNLLDASNQ
jgi:DNA-binding transcriptional ArsR family regulator